MVSYAFDVRDLIQNNRVDLSDINKLKLWSETQDCTPKLSDQQICLFLMACENDVENTKKCITEFYSVRKNAPDVFDNRDIDRNEIQIQLKTLQFCVLPLRTADNKCIIINRLSDPVPANYHMDIAMKILFMTYDSVLYENPPSGIIILFDMNLTGLRHITRTKFGILKMVTHYVQHAMPIKLTEIHVLNVMWFINKFLAVLRPVIRKELMDKVHLHTADKMDIFYEKHLPKSHLPEDYGGELPCVEELHKENCLNLSRLKKHFSEEENHRRDFYNSIN